MGASLTPDGVNFAVFSANAAALDLCLYAAGGRHEVARLPFADRTGDIWHIHVAGARAGLQYGLRAHGAYEPEAGGHRFNPNKLLLDPYAKAWSGRLRWSDALMGYRVGSPRGDLSFDARDSAFAMPKSVVVGSDFDWEDDRPPLTPWSDTVIYEAHVRALTMNHPVLPHAIRGSYAALGHPAIVDHLKRLGVSAIELLPVHGYFDDRFLVAKGLRNHWGYNSLGFFLPEPRYGQRDPLVEFKSSVKALHKAGIEVFLDVVYNHSGEGDEWGPTLSFRGLDNASYYRLIHGGRHYMNDAGTGNTLDLTHPAVLRMVMDSLRYWVQECHVDGFRFDLGTVLGREPDGFSPQAGFFAALRQDPLLQHVKLIAEPWDIGMGGYQLGAFPPPFAEWNDKYRDGLRRFWKGDAGQAPDLARRLLASADRFDHDRRPATSSVNYVTSHDGFTLEDLVSYTVKRNFANGEDNRDGHDDNHADNLGVEGPSDSPTIRAARDLRKRNLLATLMLSQGTPMILAGDEIGHSQGGNNNAYAQDNDITRLNWARADTRMAAFVARLVRLRRDHPVLRQERFLHGAIRKADGQPDVVWRHADGRPPNSADWHDPSFRAVGVELRMAAPGDDATDMVYLLINGGGPLRAVLPPNFARWRHLLDTTRPDATAAECLAQLDLPGQSVHLFQPILSEGAAK
jgi:glycogen operon protein